MRIVISITVVVLLALTTTYAAETVVKDQRLVQAVKAGDSTTAVALLGKKIDPNIAEPDGTTPLHWAVRNNDIALVDRLIRAGADVKATNRYGISAIALACESGSAPIVERLIAAGVSANATGPYGETALHTCAHAGKVEAAKVLIARGASLDAGATRGFNSPGVVAPFGGVRLRLLSPHLGRRVLGLLGRGPARPVVRRMRGVELVRAVVPRVLRGKIPVRIRH